MNITIDSKSLPFEKGEYILEIARRSGIGIPTLCEHKAVEPFGACRLCLVEITRPEWEGWSRLVTSCLYPAQDGLIVSTKSDKVKRTRAVILDLLIARCPEVEELRQMARVYGVAETSFVRRKDYDRCILCGTCTRVCEKVGTVAISTIGRGVLKKVDVPLAEEGLSTCVGCLSCAHSCPTGAIPFEDSEEQRKIWGITFEIAKCSVCGKSLGVTPQQIEHSAQQSGLDKSYFEHCEICNNRKTADKFASVIFK